ncbi:MULTISPECIES: hypothetical protein [unclassified Brevundimonas]|uniref:hypothetical protein n=1 Tax=unclassified Brevundimonas TaxID=2622653 RepID=UPI003F8D9A77
MTSHRSALVVPVDLAALCVGETDVNGSSVQPYGTKDFARLAPDFSLLPYAEKGVARNSGPYTSAQVLATAFQPASQPLGVGVHLHWALPEALTHGAQAATGKVEFPPAPNRWMVVRVASNTADPVAPVTDINAWIIESDRLWDREGQTVPLPNRNRTSLDIPIKPIPTAASNRSFRTLGQVFPYAGWAEDPSADRAQLTALGFGDVQYAATYEYCANVFGLWDTLEDLDAGCFPPATTRLSYRLIGWHAEIGDDPLSRVKYPADGNRQEQIAAIEAQLKWVFPFSDDAPFPTRTVYSALLTEVPWDPGNHYIDPRTPSADLEIAVGNTSCEAVSALLAAQPGLESLPNVEIVLNALQAGLLSRLSLPGGLADMDEVLHQKGFASSNVDQTWVITSDATKGAGLGGEIPPEQMLSAARNQSLELPAGTGAALDALNKAQSALDRMTQETASLRGRIFADWCRYMSIEYAPPPPGLISPNDARVFIEAEIAELKTLLASAAAMQTEVSTRAEALRRSLGEGYTLDTSDGSRYWAPSDPVVLVSGADVRPSYRGRMPDARDADGNLICRMDAGIVSAMIAGDAPFAVHAADLPILPAAGPTVLAEVLPALVGEAFFADPWQAPVLAAAVAALGGDSNPAKADYPGLIAAIAAAQRVESGPDVPVITFVGDPILPGSAKPWSPPWIPIILQWQTSFYPNELPVYDPDFILDAYELDESDIDLRFKGGIPVDPTTVRTYQGTIVLSHGVEIDLAQQIRTYLTNFPDDNVDGELKTILDELDLSAQAQALNGFNQAFLMLDHVLQMEVSDPLAILQGLFFSRFTNQDVKDAVAGFNVNSPKFNNTFCPIRNGALSIDRLRVIDAFGQILDLAAPQVIRAQSLKAPDDGQDLISLPIRFTQPLRLQFNWLAADDDQLETNSDPVTTPVIGWVLYNHLDDALAVYDTAGRAIGSFNLRGPFWQGAPGNVADYGKPVEDAFASANPHLRAFALGLARSADPVGYLTEMLAAIDRAVTFISPRTYKQDSGLAILIGRPLALVRASLKLDLMGLPAADQSTRAFAAAIAGDDVLARDNGGTLQLRVPVRLGDLSDVDDGLVGYFIENGDDTYRAFYSPAAAASDKHGLIKPGFGQVFVTSDPAAAPAFLTMLVDPHAAVHATTGLLPMKELTIPPTMIADDLADMAVTFLTTPFIFGGAPELPTPEEGGFVWNWVAQNGAGWTIEPVQSPSGAISTGPRHAVEGWLSLSPTGKPKTRLQD